MIETLREVRSAEYQKLWRRTPGSLGIAIWILAVAGLGWDIGVPTGVSVVVLLALLTEVVPSHWTPVEWIVDLSYETVMRAWVLRALWLLLLVDLWLIRGAGPLALLQVLGMFVASLFLPFVIRRLIGFVRPRPRNKG